MNWNRVIARLYRFYDLADNDGLLLFFMDECIYTPGALDPICQPE